MTFVCCVKVESGLVLAADTTMTLHRGDVVETTWTTARKLFPVFRGEHKRLPVGLLRWGDDDVQLPLEEVIQEFRARACTERDPYHLPPALYNVRQCAETFRRFMQAEYLDPLDAQDAHATMGFLVAGYGAYSDTPGVFEVTWTDGRPDALREVLTAGSGIHYAGQTRAADRLLKGYDHDLLPAVTGALWGNSDKAQAILTEYDRKATRRLTHPSMPLPDAARAARWLVETTAGFARYLDDYATVGGAVEMCALGRHTGYRWLEKHKKRWE